MTDSEADLEQQLRELYNGADPPPALAGQILARARQARNPGTRRVRAVCAAVVVACVLVAVPWMHRRQAERQRALDAQARLVYALQITTGELHWAESKIGQDLAAPRARLAAGQRPKGANRL